MIGLVTGQNLLVDRLNFGSSTKVWPVSLDRAKDHIQVTHDLDDSLIADLGGYIAAATGETENRGNVALIRQSRIQTVGPELISSLSGKSISLLYGPVIAVTAVKYLDEDAVEQTLPTQNWNQHFSQVYFFGTLPTFFGGPNAVWIEYEAGYGSTPNAVPAEWANVVLTILSRMYDFRSGDSGNSNDSWERLIRQKVNVAGGSYRG